MAATRTVRMDRRCLITRVVMRAPCFLVGVILLAAAAFSADSDIKQFDLRSLGFTVPKFGESRAPYPVDGLVCFLDNETFAVAFLVANPDSDKLVTRTTSRWGNRYRLSTAFVDFESGKVASSHLWPLPEGVPMLACLQGGSFVIATGSSYAGFARDYTLLGHKEFDSRENPHDDLRVSPDGRYVYIAHWVAQNTLRITTFEGPDLREISRVEVRSSPWWTASGDRLVVKWDNFELPIRSIISLKTGTEPPKTLFEFPLSSRPCTSGAVPVFIGDDRLVMAGRCPELVVFDVTGRELARNKIERGELGGVTPARSGSRFAAFIGEQKGGSAFLDIPPHPTNCRIVVYDSATFLEIEAFPIDMRGKRFPAYALSPDGSKLAYLQEGVVHLKSIKVVGQMPH
jgi:hypothetical protein